MKLATTATVDQTCSAFLRLLVVLLGLTQQFYLVSLHASKKIECFEQLTKFVTTEFQLISYITGTRNVIAPKPEG